MPARPRLNNAVRLPVAALVAAAVSLASAGVPVAAQPPQAGAKKQDRDRPADGGDAEEAALAFVRENHPELAALLAQLKPMKPDEYRRAVRELAQVGRNLSAVKAVNPERHALLLEAWKARSRVELLAARLASASGPGGDAEGQLRQAVEAQVDAEIRVQRFDKRAAEARLRRLAENLDRAESRRDSAVEARTQSLMKKGQRAHRRAAKTGADGPAGAANVKYDPAAAGNEAGGGSSQGERLP